MSIGCDVADAKVLLVGVKIAVRNCRPILDGFHVHVAVNVG
jgi:hypothetical protein